MAPHEIEAQHPGEFISHLLDLNLSAGLAAFARYRQTLKNPPKTVDEYLNTLLQQGLPDTVRQPRPYAAAL
ncbi:hypothetical protein [Chromobacterium subtsugae]|uniref:hypothetical protein n=1 Tax=Chromobacterium subtsugae TaxID=251747 RepID=UPI00069CBA40|nr:hypothetical protein [Chromobacterium subtsugae]